MDTFKRKLLEQSWQEAIGLIYAVSDLGEYYVEVLHQGQEQSIFSENDIRMYASISAAKQFMSSQGCRQCYVCLDNTYDECGCDANNDRFCYMLVQ